MNKSKFEIKVSHLTNYPSDWPFWLLILATADIHLPEILVSMRIVSVSILLHESHEVCLFASNIHGSQAKSGWEKVGWSLVEKL